MTTSCSIPGLNVPRSRFPDPEQDLPAAEGEQRVVLAGVNAGVVGLLLAALYDPVWVSAVHGAHDLALVLAIWVCLAVWRVPVWVLAPLSALAGVILLS